MLPSNEFSKLLLKTKREKNIPATYHVKNGTYPHNVNHEKI